MPVPTPLPFHGSVVPLEEKCGVADCVVCKRGGLCAQRCEKWTVIGCSDSLVPSFPLGAPGTNYPNFKPIAAAGGRPMCPGSPAFSRVSIAVPYIKPSVATGNPALVAPPPLHVEIRMGHEGVVSRVARLVWTPNDFEDYGLLCQVSGLLVSRVEIWAWCEYSPGVGDAPAFALPVTTKFEMLIDRMGGAFDVWLNDLANVFADES